MRIDPIQNFTCFLLSKSDSLVKLEYVFLTLQEQQQENLLYGNVLQLRIWHIDLTQGDICTCNIFPGEKCQHTISTVCVSSAINGSAL